MNIAILGLGYVGSVTGACLANLGHRVRGIDRDELKVASILRGEAPFYEPGLNELIQANVAQGRLSATSSIAEALDDADVAIICVGTPSERNGNLGLGQIRRACEEIAGQLPGRAKRLIVVVRSTVFPGTCREVVIPALGSGNFAVVSNPEFLREGTAVKDFMEPTFVVVGGDDLEAVDAVASLYSPLNAEVARVTLGTAEMIKYGCNAWHALKVAFANEMGAICSKLDIPASEVMATLCKDTRLNVSAAYLKPGFAFGGSCLPKDLRALNYRSRQLDLALPVLDNVLASNQRHLQRSIQTVIDLPARRIGIYGLAFKENTDDLRESPVLELLEQLMGKGKELAVFDPHVRIEGIHGANRSYVMDSIPHIGRLMRPSLGDLLSWADALVIAQKPSPEALATILAAQRPVVDLVCAVGQSPNQMIP